MMGVGAGETGDEDGDRSSIVIGCMADYGIDVFLSFLVTGSFGGVDGGRVGLEAEDD